MRKKINVSIKSHAARWQDSRAQFSVQQSSWTAVHVPPSSIITFDLHDTVTVVITGKENFYWLFLSVHTTKEMCVFKVGKLFPVICYIYIWSNNGNNM